MEKGGLAYGEAISETIARATEKNRTLDKIGELRDISHRLYRLNVYEARNENETPETIANTLTRDPLTVVNYLLDIIDDLQGV